MVKISDKNTVKWSYSCHRNISSKISSNNQKIINLPLSNDSCNCKFLTPGIVCQAILSATNKPDKKYFGIFETSFKTL